jgi:hypothetical protein
VSDSASDFFTLAVSPTDPAVRASLWSLCTVHHQGCQRTAEAVAVTDDGFHTVRSLRIENYSSIAWVSGDEFAVQTGPHAFALVGAEEGSTPLHFDPAPAPLAASDALLSTPGQAIAVERSAAIAHPVPIIGVHEKALAVVRDSGQTLVAVPSGRPRIAVSLNGGGSWQNRLDLPSTFLPYVITSTAPHLMAVAEEGDDGVVDPGNLRRSTDGGATWQTIAHSDLSGAIASWLTVQSDGRLLVDVTDWTTGTPASSKARSGLYVSNGADWTTFQRVQSTPAMPGTAASSAAGGDLISSTLDAQGHDVLLVYAYEGKTPLALSSNDGGSTWEPLRVR